MRRFPKVVLMARAAVSGVEGGAGIPARSRLNPLKAGQSERSCQAATRHAYHATGDYPVEWQAGLWDRVGEANRPQGAVLRQRSVAAREGPGKS